MSGLNGLPRWWLSLTKTFSPGLMQDLLRAVERAGVSPNDRAQVERIWLDRQRARAQVRVLQAEMTGKGEGADD